MSELPYLFIFFIVLPFLFGFFFKKKSSYKRPQDFVVPFSFVFGMFFFWSFYFNINRIRSGSPISYIDIIAFSTAVGLLTALAVVTSFYIGHRFGKQKNR